MIRLFLITFSFYLIISCNTNQKENPRQTAKKVVEVKNVTNDRISQLKEAFSKTDYPTFFKLFPNTYAELVEFYGFDENTGAKKLYDLYDAHINYFFQYEGKINQEDFIKKVYDISRDGVWDADAVGLFQSNLSRLIINTPNLFLETFANKPDKEVKEFWFFILDGSGKNDLQNKEKFKTIYAKINLLNPTQAQILKLKFEEMYK